MCLAVTSICITNETVCFVDYHITTLRCLWIHSSLKEDNAHMASANASQSNVQSSIIDHNARYFSRLLCLSGDWLAF